MQSQQGWRRGGSRQSERYWDIGDLGEDDERRRKNREADRARKSTNKIETKGTVTRASGLARASKGKADTGLGFT